MFKINVYKQRHESIDGIQSEIANICDRESKSVDGVRDMIWNLRWKVKTLENGQTITCWRRRSRNQSGEGWV